MSDTLREAAAALRRTGDGLADLGAGLTALDPGPRAFGADLPGAPGELTRQLHVLLRDALQARSREAAAHGARIASTADAVARAAGHYDDVDADARARTVP